MGISFSLVLLALGAILAFAVQDNVAELDLAAIGWVIMIVGLLGLLFWSSVAPFGESFGYTRRRREVHERYLDEEPMSRRTVIDEYDEAPRRRIVEETRTHDHV